MPSYLALMLPVAETFLLLGAAPDHLFGRISGLLELAEVFTSGVIVVCALYLVL